MKHGQRIVKLGALSLGDLIAIPLPSGLYAHARVYRDTFGVYTGLSKELKDLADFERRRPKRFFYCMSMPGSRYQKNWIYVGHLPFEEGEDVDAPPTHARDDFGLSGIRVYHRGQFWRASRSDVRGLQVFTIYSPPSLENYLAGKRYDPYRKVHRRMEAARNAAGGALPDDGVLAGWDPLWPESDSQ